MQNERKRAFSKCLPASTLCPIRGVNCKFRCPAFLPNSIHPLYNFFASSWCSIINSIFLNLHRKSKLLPAKSLKKNLIPSILLSRVMNWEDFIVYFYRWFIIHGVDSTLCLKLSWCKYRDSNEIIKEIFSPILFLLNVLLPFVKESWQISF